jgi:hypothetical protein
MHGTAIKIKESLRVLITTMLMELLMELQLQRLPFPTRLVIMLSYTLSLSHWRSAAV